MKRILFLFIRSFFFILGFLFFSCGGGDRPGQEQNTAMEKANVLFIAVDDLNDWIGAMHGHPNAKTPHLDKLANRGVLFTNAHCQAPLCGPSRASLMTGLRPSTTGIYGMIDDNLIREKNEVTKEIIYLPEYFRTQGYHTMGVGKLFHSHAPTGAFNESGGREKGFGPLPEERFVWDGYGSGDENYGRTSTDWGAFPEADSLMPDYRSSQWAIERLNREYDQPFFLAVGYLRPHVPFYAPPEWFEMHPVESVVTPPYKEDDLDDIPPIGMMLNDLPMMPSTEWAIKNNEWSNIVQAYLACVSFVDHQVGELLNALDNSNYAENTVVVLWSDHGYRLGEKGTFAKHALWEEATNAPLLFAGPGISKGKVIDQPVEMLSIYPTLLDVCGLPAYERNEGSSLVKLLKGGEGDPDAVAITTFGMKNHSVRSSQYRYIQYEDGTEELYDRHQDPNEWVNLATDQSYLEVKRKMEQRLPSINLPWAEHSEYKFQPYFREQKARTSLPK